MLLHLTNKRLDVHCTFKVKVEYQISLNLSANNGNGHTPVRCTTHSQPDPIFQILENGSIQGKKDTYKQKIIICELRLINGRFLLSILYGKPINKNIQVNYQWALNCTY